jgi:RNA polymerase sigma-B factor
MSVLAIPAAASEGKLDRPKRAEQSGAEGREAVLFRRYQRYGDLKAREELVESFLPLARRLARRYERETEPLDDLVQVASLGLLKAIDRFDSTRGPDFISYAIPTMLGELRRYFRDSSWALHVPRGMQERVLKVSETAEYMSQKLGRPATAKQLATELRISVEDVLDAMEASSAYSTVSLDVPPGPDEDDRPARITSAGERDHGFDLTENRMVLAGALRGLPPRERRILLLRFRAGMTQAEIGELLGLSQMHVCRLIRRALERLRILARADEA